MELHFALRPVERIEPWTRDGRPWLSWFGLSDGWYWLRVGDQELFRAADASANAGASADDGDAPPYADYQVARLWEDVLDLLPSVLADVPGDVAAPLAHPERWLAAVDRLQADDAADAALVAAGLGWWHARALSSGHLVAPPRLWLWRTGAALHGLWRPSAEAASPWRPASGAATGSVDGWLAAVRAFDRAFVDAMGERVRALVRAGGLGGVDVDLAHLEVEQRDRAGWLARALGASPPADDWSAARALVAHARRAGLL